MRLSSSGLLRRATTSFAPSSFPLMSRQGYVWELRSALFTPFAIACVEGSVVAIIAKKAFDADPMTVAFLTATPALSNLTTAYWMRMIHARDRVRTICTLQLLVLLCVAIIAFAPFEPKALGIGMLLLGTTAGRCCMAGLVAARSDLWRGNYPDGLRARAASKITIIMTLSMGISGMLVAVMMDLAVRYPILGFGDPRNAFRLFYGFAILTALIGVWCFSHVRWRGGASQVAQEIEGSAEQGNRRPGASAMVRVLKDDKNYRAYMLAMFALGLPNIASTAPFVIGLEREFGVSYSESIGLTFAIPILIPILVLPLWAKLLDGVHVVTFRVYHCWFFIVANALTGIGFLIESLELLYVARVMLGLAFGGGMLAWNLGHHDFATRCLANVYMGIHATLTGVRGVIGPFIGVIMFDGMLRFGGASLNLPFPAMGGWTFVAFSAVGLLSAVMFFRLHHKIRAQRSTEA